MPKAPPAPSPEEPVVKALETFGGDVNRVIQTGEVSLASIAAAEAKRAHAASGMTVAPGDVAPEAGATKRSSMRPVLYIAGGLLLLSALGIIAAIFIHPSTAVQRTVDPLAPFMEVDQTIVVPPRQSLTRDALMTDLEAKREGLDLSLGLIGRLFPEVASTTGSAPELMPVTTLLATLAPDIPQSLLLTIQPQYLLGIHSYDENQTFLILRVDSYQQAYAGMLAWEPTMRRDLLPLFERNPSPHLPPAVPQAPVSTTTASSTAATSTQPAPATQILQTGFTDQVVDNHDARVITNDAGDLLLLWTFLDRNTLVITTNEYTLNEVIRRLNTASLVPQP